MSLLVTLVILSREICTYSTVPRREYYARHWTACGQNWYYIAHFFFSEGIRIWPPSVRTFEVERALIFSAENAWQTNLSLLLQQRTTTLAAARVRNKSHCFLLSAVSAYQGQFLRRPLVSAPVTRCRLCRQVQVPSYRDADLGSCLVFVISHAGTPFSGNLAVVTSGFASVAETALPEVASCSSCLASVSSLHDTQIRGTGFEPQQRRGNHACSPQRD